MDYIDLTSGITCVGIKILRDRIKRTELYYHKIVVDDVINLN